MMLRPRGKREGAFTRDISKRYAAIHVLGSLWKVSVDYTGDYRRLEQFRISLNGVALSGSRRVQAAKASRDILGSKQIICVLVLVLFAHRVPTATRLRTESIQTSRNPSRNKKVIPSLDRRDESQIQVPRLNRF